MAQSKVPNGNHMLHEDEKFKHFVVQSLQSLVYFHVSNNFFNSSKIASKLEIFRDPISLNFLVTSFQKSTSFAVKLKKRLLFFFVSLILASNRTFQFLHVFLTSMSTPKWKPYWKDECSVVAHFFTAQLDQWHAEISLKKCPKGHASTLSSSS